MMTMLFIRGKCTIDKISDLFDIFTMILTEINFDDSKSILQNSLKSSLSAKKSDLASRGHAVANRRIRGRYSVRCKRNQIVYIALLDHIIL
jgi:Zn-dependent M16 (insulinase) family peptidase